MTASGIHADHAPMYIRNIQLNKDTEVARLLKRLNPHMVEESVWSAGKTDYVVSFPVVPKKGSYYKEDMIGIKHLELIAKAQKHWVNAGTNPELCADPGVRHNVSNTVIVDDWDAVAEYVYNNRDSFAGISFLAMTGDKDYAQAPNTKIIDAKEIVKTYGTGSIFASGLVVDGLDAFDNLWVACMRAASLAPISDSEHNHILKTDWVRRFRKFAENYFEDDLKRAEYCLKDVFLLHKWEKIQQNLVQDIDWEDQLVEKKYIDIDTMGAAACVGGACEV